MIRDIGLLFEYVIGTMMTMKEVYEHVNLSIGNERYLMTDVELVERSE